MQQAAEHAEACTSIVVAALHRDLCRNEQLP